MKLEIPEKFKRKYAAIDASTLSAKTVPESESVKVESYDPAILQDLSSRIESNEPLVSPPTKDELATRSLFETAESSEDSFADDMWFEPGDMGDWFDPGNSHHHS